MARSVNDYQRELARRQQQARRQTLKAWIEQRKRMEAELRKQLEGAFRRGGHHSAKQGRLRGPFGR